MKYTIISTSSVPEPVLSPIINSDGTVPVQSLDSFIVSFLIEVDPAVDIPLEVEALWSGNPSLFDAPRVTIEPTTSHVPYLTSLIFDSIKPHDLGEYNLSVVLVSTREWVISSAELQMSMSLSLGKYVL